MMTSTYTNFVLGILKLCWTHRTNLWEQMEVHSGGDQDLNQALLPEEEEDKDDDDSLILEALVLRAVHS